MIKFWWTEFRKLDEVEAFLAIFLFVFISTVSVAILSILFYEPSSISILLAIGLFIFGVIKFVKVTRL